MRLTKRLLCGVAADARTSGSESIQSLIAAYNRVLLAKEWDFTSFTRFCVCELEVVCIDLFCDPDTLHFIRYILPYMDAGKTCGLDRDVFGSWYKLQVKVPQNTPFRTAPFLQACSCIKVFMPWGSAPKVQAPSTSAP
jgi:hypothetical protein